MMLNGKVKLLSGVASKRKKMGYRAMSCEGQSVEERTGIRMVKAIYKLHFNPAVLTYALARRLKPNIRAGVQSEEMNKHFSLRYNSTGTTVPYPSLNLSSTVHPSVSLIKV
jgi:hypothetical protein